MTDFSPYLVFTREEWKARRAQTPITLSAAELAELQGLNEPVSLREVEEVYLPITRLLNLYYEATQDLFRATSTFLGRDTAKVPYTIGLAGSVAVGKSTTARVLRALLARGPNRPKVELIPTDGFLYPNAELERRGLMNRKGFPESYDLPALLSFLDHLKSGRPRVSAPVYSHVSYDILDGERIEIERPDVAIIEGLNILHGEGNDPEGRGRVFVSDFFDLSIYVDAPEEVIRRWYVERFLTLRETSFRDRASYFHRYARLSEDEAREVAERIWDEINGKNLRENILPTRGRADLVLRKAPDHSVERVALRRV